MRDVLVIGAFLCIMIGEKKIDGLVRKAEER